MDELAGMLSKRFNINPKQAVLDALMLEIDEDNDGQIDEDEFVKFFKSIQELTDQAGEHNNTLKKKRILKAVLNVTVVTVFVLVALMGMGASRECEDICRVPGTCEGRTRAACTLRCISPKPITVYTEYNLVGHLLFWVFALGREWLMRDAVRICMGFAQGLHEDIVSGFPQEDLHAGRVSVLWHVRLCKCPEHKSGANPDLINTLPPAQVRVLLGGRVVHVVLSAGVLQDVQQGVRTATARSGK